MGRDIGYPLVMKLNSPDITHKTDAGGVRLDLRSDTDVRAAFVGIVAIRPPLQAAMPGSKG